MADSAFNSAPFPAFTTAELRAKLAVLEGRPHSAPLNNMVDRIRAEIARREAVAAGDVSQMTDGERLRFARSAKARA